MVRKGAALFAFAFLLFLFVFPVFAEPEMLTIPSEGSVLINEFAVDPQTDWDAGGTIGSSDEWFELYNTETLPIDLTGWNLTMEDTTITVETLAGIISPLGYLTIQNPNGIQGNDGKISLYDSSGNLIDTVTYGSFDDGNTSDNAPTGNANNIYDECLARYPNAIDTNQDSVDFIKTLCTYNSENNFTFTPVEISDMPSTPSCALETDNLTLSANITGSIEQVILNLNSQGSWHEIILVGNQEGIYQYIVPASELSDSFDLQWQFEVRDIIGQENLGALNSQDIKAATSLGISPELPDGLNGWYITEPQFILENPDAAEINYRWNGEVHTTTSGEFFGLEGAPNNGNVTGGILVLHHSSEVCNEAEKSFIGKFDFLSPQIKSLSPEHNSSVFNTPNLTISALIDEMYQSNSGIDNTSITMQIDSNFVTPIVQNSGLLDANVLYAGTLPDGTHEVILTAADFSGRTSQKTWSFELVPVSNFSLIINKPQAGIFTDRRVEFNISLTRTAEEIEFINNNDHNPNWKRLCKNCDGYGNDRKRTFSLNEGQNEISIRAFDDLGSQDEKSVSIVVDSKDPKIGDTSPAGGIASGLFEVEFDEVNPYLLTLHYGTPDSLKNVSLNISEDCVVDRRYKCSRFVDLTEFENHEIGYYFTLEDIAGNKEDSRERNLKVDLSTPVINAFSYEINRNQVTFLLEINESNPKEITYIDFMESSPKEKRLCSSLDAGICEKKITVKDGFHNITVNVYDSSGNHASASAFFFTDSDSPRILKVLPRGGFASGLFEVEFEEENPSQLVLNYGTPGIQWTYEVDFNSCLEGKTTICEVSVDLLDFEGQDIFYLFNMTDTVGNYEESKKIKLKVDSTPPGVNEFNYTVNGRTVSFFFDIDEVNFDKVEYFDQRDLGSRFKTLCTRLNDEGICTKELRFKPGEHKIDIHALDKAGNEVIIVENLEFTISDF